MLMSTMNAGVYVLFLLIHYGTSVDIRMMRSEFYHEENQAFLEKDLPYKDPISVFRVWFFIASRTVAIDEPNAMSLATATKDGRPSNRMILLKDYGEDGFIFYTNYESRKAKELDENPRAALTFFWEYLHRSVRIEGTVEKTSEEDSNSYFSARPRPNQISSSISNQSTVIRSRVHLTDARQEMNNTYFGRNITRPKHWGGYRVIPERIEFWSGQNDRLHDRILFRRKHENEVIDSTVTHEGTDGWYYERLSP